jgi:hypothetical protein
MKRMCIVALILTVACSKKSSPGPPITINLSAIVTHSPNHIQAQAIASDSIPGVTISGAIHYEWFYHGALVDSVNTVHGFPGTYNTDETQRPDWPYYNNYPDTALSIKNVKVTGGVVDINNSGRQVTLSW